MRKYTNGIQKVREVKKRGRKGKRGEECCGATDVFDECLRRMPLANATRMCFALGRLCCEGELLCEGFQRGQLRCEGELLREGFQRGQLCCEGLRPILITHPDSYREE